MTETDFAPLFPDAAPIFVLGAARSGTSIACDALRFGAGIPGNRESYLFSTAYLLITHLDARWREIAPGIEHFANVHRGNPKLERSLARFDFSELQRHMLRHFHELSTPNGERVWVDKTPDIYMVHAVPMMAPEYPKGRWVFMKRNGIEVLDSRRRTAPEMTFEEACRDWALVMTDWLRARPYIEGRWLEVDQREIAMARAATAQRLADFLDLDAVQQAGIAEAFATQRPGQTTSRPYGEEVTLAAVDWPEAEKATFRAVCGDAMREHGYRL